MSGPRKNDWKEKESYGVGRDTSSRPRATVSERKRQNIVMVTVEFSLDNTE